MRKFTWEGFKDMILRQVLTDSLPDGPLVAELRSRCNELEAQRDTARQTVRELYAESYDLSEQLAAARSKALDEAIITCTWFAGTNTRDIVKRAALAIIDEIHALKS